MLTNPYFFLNKYSQFRLNDPSLAAIVQFAVRNLGVQHIVIVGHTNCGGVRGALEAVFPPQAPKVEDGDPESAPTPSLNIPPALGDWLQPLIEDIKNTQPPNLGEFLQIALF
jgi:carbonic anhydrase